MNGICELPGGLALQLDEYDPQVVRPPGPQARRSFGGYPTRRLARGLRLVADGEDLSEEGVGFGVPVLKRGLQTVFPGSVTIDVRPQRDEGRVTAVFTLDLVERLRTRRTRSLPLPGLYAAKDLVAALHRGAPPLRRPLTAASQGVRRVLGLATTYEPAAVVAVVPVTFSVRLGRPSVEIAVDLRGVPGGVTEIVVMNELGAGVFDRYADSSGVELAGDRISTWSLVGAERARFESTSRRVGFELDAAPDLEVPGVRLYRGREHVGSRLAWAGFGYSLRPGPQQFTYRVRFERGAETL